MPKRVTVYISREREQEIKRLQSAIIQKTRGSTWSESKILEQCFDLAKDLLLETLYPGRELIEGQRSRIDTLEREVETTASIDRLLQIGHETWTHFQENRNRIQSIPEDPRAVHDYTHLCHGLTRLSRRIEQRVMELQEKAALTRPELSRAIDQLRSGLPPLGTTTADLIRTGRELRGR